MKYGCVDVRKSLPKWPRFCEIYGQPARQQVETLYKMGKGDWAKEPHRLNKVRCFWNGSLSRYHLGCLRWGAPWLVTWRVFLPILPFHGGLNIGGTLFLASIGCIYKCIYTTLHNHL